MRKYIDDCSDFCRWDEGERGIVETDDGYRCSLGRNCLVEKIYEGLISASAAAPYEIGGPFKEIIEKRKKQIDNLSRAMQEAV